MKNIRSLSLAFLIPGLAAGAIAGCATPGARPQDMSAQAHVQESASHELQAEQHEAQYDPAARRTRQMSAASSIVEPTDLGYNPTAHHGAIAEQHRRHARDHAAATKKLETFEEGECGSFEPAVRATCPLLGRIVAVENIAKGVRIQFADDVNMDAALAHIRCHFAYAAKRGRKGMHRCPLYLKGVEAQKSGERTVDLTASDDQTIDAVRRRTANHVTN